MSLAGALNGTNVVLAIETAVPDTYEAIGGLISNSTSGTNAAIDITNKSSASWREIMDAEGLQTMDISAECIFSTEANFALLKAAFNSKTITKFQIARGAEVIAGSFYVTALNESAPDNDKVTASITMSSSGPVTGV